MRKAGVAAAAVALVSALLLAGAPARAATLDCATEPILDPPGPATTTSDSIVSADGTTVVFGATNLPTPTDPAGTGQVGAYDVATGALEWLDLPDASSPFALSPDGRRVVTTSSEGWHLVDRDQGTTTLVLDRATALDAGGVDWRGDGVLLASRAEQLERIDLTTGDVLDTFVLPGPIAHVRVSADGGRALVSVRTSTGPSSAGFRGTMVDTTDGTATPVDDAAAAWSYFSVPPFVYTESGPGRVAVPDADGSHVLFTSDADLGGANPGRDVHLWAHDVAGDSFARVTVDGASVRDGAISVSADGSTAFTDTSGSDRSAAVDLATGTVEVVPLGGPLRSDATGRLVASSGSARLFERDEQRMVRIVGEGDRFDEGSPDLGAGGHVVTSSSRDLDGSNPDRSNELWALDGPPASLLTDVRAAHSDEPAVDGSGDVVAFTSTADLDPSGPGNGDGSAELFVLDRSTDQVEQLTDLAVAEGDPSSVAISADAGTVAFSSRAALGDAETAGQQLVHLAADGALHSVVDPSNAPGVPDTEMPRVPLDVSDDGRWLLLQGSGDPVGANPDRGNELFRWDAEERTLVQVSSTPAGPVGGQHAVSAGLADDGTVAYVQRYVLHVMEPDAAEAVQVATPALMWGAQISHDGRYAYTDDRDGPVRRLDLDSLVSVVTALDRPAAQVDAAGRVVLHPASGSRGLERSRCAAFVDVALDHPFAEDVEWAADEGITTGYADQTFRPGATVTRQAMAAFLHRLAGADGPAPATAPFADVPTSHPFATEIAWAAGEGITTGYQDGTFRPGATVTRQATAAFLHRTAALL